MKFERRKWNRKGAGTDIFLFIILSFVIIFICAIFIYLGGRITTQVHNVVDNMTFGDKSGSTIVDQSLGKVNEAYQNLYWISWVLIIGMAIGIFIGSYLVTTKPVFMIPMIFLGIIAIIVSAIISNAYGQIISDPTLASTFNGFVGANFIMGYFPIWTTVIFFIGLIIMFSRMGSREQSYGGSY